ncbi:hypothetical protein [Brevibacillus fulvus]|uniref:Uncharacterized protein n=1 Tax=Brevibacillus fulvus TaxID=1125967 RepID=A0A938XZZ6_9BACL|nr:hypothetical protein [Brevibacillus fulvus]MBM7590861.1 hypothetical protein [Brevibacillus fulvus]
MALKDILIMEVPSGALKQIISERELDARKNSIDEMAEEISDKVPDVGQALADQFQFAGATAVNIHVMMSGIPAEWHNKDFFRDHLIQKYGSTIFTRGIRPQLNEKPQLIRAYELGNKMVLAFSLLGSPRRFLEDFEIVVRSPQILEYVVIHFSPFAFEIRASQSQNEVFKQAVLQVMDIQGEVIWDKITKLNDLQANELARRLGAKLRAAKHKMTEGVYATKEVTANTQVEDLEQTEEYKKEFTGTPMKKKTLVFRFKYSFGFEEDISYVITDEGLWFRTKVGEEVIEHVLHEILLIKFPQTDVESDQGLDEEELVVETSE